MAETLQYAKGYNDYNLNNFVGLIPIRELEDCEEIDGICQIKDERTGIWHIGFVVKKWETASTYTSEWIGSKPVNWYQTFKVICRDVNTKRQVKRRVYNTHEDFLRYGEKLIERYNRYHDVEVYVYQNKKWVLTNTYKAKIES